MADKSVNVTAGPGLGVLLFITFLVLKLTGVINWSWWWVTCPLWAGFALLLVIFLVVVLFALILK